MSEQQTLDTIKIKAKLNDREQTFCRLMATGIITPTEAYRQSGYSETGADGNSIRLIGKDRIKEEIRRLRLELAIKDGITREIQARKLEEVRLRCNEAQDNSNEIRAIEAQNQLYGLKIDRLETNTEQRELDSERQRLAEEAAKALMDKRLHSERKIEVNNG
jgi:phage terminase small subunit